MERSRLLRVLTFRDNTLLREALNKQFAFPQGLKPHLNLQWLTYGLKPVPFKTAHYSEVP
jgi:hypothetical protein